MLTDDQRKLMTGLESVFFAHAKNRRDKLVRCDRRLVHYTSAENAISIIRSKTFWMRDTRSMADFREVEHGYGVLQEYFQQQGKREAFFAAFDRHHVGVGNDVVKRFDDSWALIRTETYVSCFSEHGEHEDRYGRLSMWRGYGRNAGVAMIFKIPDPYAAIPLNVSLSPVVYSKEVFRQEFDDAIKRIQATGEALMGLGRDWLVYAGYRMLVMAAISLKHPAFLEEREWRLIHLPFETPSPYVKSETATIQGIPQVVYKIGLENRPADDVTGVALPELLASVMIGPTQYPGLIHASLLKELLDAGVDDAASRIKVADVPLRT